MLTLILFQFHGGARLFLESNFVQNARWRVRFSPVGASPIFRFGSSLFRLGMPQCFRRWPLLPRALARGDALVVVHFIGLMAGAFLIPVPYLQYFAMLLPLSSPRWARDS